MNSIIDKFTPYLFVLLGLFLFVFTGDAILAGISLGLSVLGLGIDINKYMPYIFVLLGILLLGYMGQIYPAVACFLIGLIMILEKIWPEKSK